MIVLRRFVRDRRRSALWWSVGIAGLTLFNNVFYPSVKNVKGLADLMKNLPATFKAFLGTNNAIGLTSPAGYLQGRQFSLLLPVTLVIFAIGLGARAIGGNEEDGSLELLMANPVTRLRVVCERCAATSGLMAFLGLIGVASMLAFSPPFGLLKDVSIAGLLAECGAAAFLALLHGMVAFAVGAITGRRGPAIAAGSGLAVVGYLVNGVAAVSDPARPLRFITPWHWYLGRNMLAQGIAVESLVAPLAFAALFAAVGFYVFPRRDLH